MPTILIVDDCRNYRDFLKLLLGHWKYRVLAAGDGAEALECLRRSRVDLVISDVLMPAMDGYEFLLRLRADSALKDTPVILHSAAKFESRARAMAEASGVRHFLLKPAKLEQLRSAVNSALGKDSMPDSSARMSELSCAMGMASSHAIDPNAVVSILDSDPPERDLSTIVTDAGHKVKTFKTAEEFLENYDVNQPGCLVLGIRLPGMSGLALLEALRSRQIDIPVIILTAYGQTAVAVKAFRLGAMDFLEKPADPQMLLLKIDCALQKDSIKRRQRTQTEPIRRRIAQLTAREQVLLKLLILGKTSREIASELYISERTVSHHRAHISAKMQARNLADLVRMSMIGFGN